ncbi:MAG: prepilin-type N-terminal cleavage/methylation domain-containing protein [Verrucomicrobia bacterium]|nr:prepilin-type N-terminal cleavage/methylation domain-containing protein [Verrucomicrobiota bacterium]
MKRTAKESGLTLIEVLVVIAIIAILAAMLIPAIYTPPVHAPGILCMNNQRQIDIAQFMWADDHGNEFPTQVSTTNNGSKELIGTGRASLEFQPLSGYLHDPKLLVCEADKTRHAAAAFTNLNDENISYFINADATISNSPSHSIFTGDRNLQADGRPVKPGLFLLTTNLEMNWTHEIHPRYGILSFVDGHVEYVRTGAVNPYIHNLPLTTNRLCVP